MYVKKYQVGGKKLHKAICDLVAIDEPMTTTEIRTALGKSKTHIVRAMRHLTNEGYFFAYAPAQFQSITWIRTEKEFIYEPKVKKQPKPRVKKQPKPKVSVKKPCKTVKKPPKPEKPVKVVKPKPLKQTPVQTIQITIKPDLAAMWLVSSRPQWATRSIPIQRSTELGVRRSTF